MVSARVRDAQGGSSTRPGVRANSPLTRWESRDHAQDQSVAESGLEPWSTPLATGLLGRVPSLGIWSIGTEHSYKRGQMLAPEVPFYVEPSSLKQNPPHTHHTDPFSSLKRLQREAHMGEKQDEFPV